MHVTLVLKEWRVKQDSETKQPVIAGRYALMMGEKEIANQEFNDGYNGKKLPFSNDTLQATMKIEEVIKADLEKLLG